MDYRNQELAPSAQVYSHAILDSDIAVDYPACPHIPDQYRQLDLLKTDRIGMWMDESEQLYAEQSTTAIITYHPVAKYFSA